ncbi:MAG: hypothetical protein K6U04_06970 [Armatimonadetes bacterium]|nr:hypothetical protein [Armatimonadota bacterium]
MLTTRKKKPSFFSLEITGDHPQLFYSYKKPGANGHLVADLLLDDTERQQESGNGPPRSWRCMPAGSHQLEKVDVHLRNDFADNLHCSIVKTHYLS